MAGKSVPLEVVADGPPLVAMVPDQGGETTDTVADVERRLTDRQRHALQKAFLGGYFDWPRETSGEDLADSMDISPSTLHQHLRAAEQKVFASLFE